MIVLVDDDGHCGLIRGNIGRETLRRIRTPGTRFLVRLPKVCEETCQRVITLLLPRIQINTDHLVGSSMAIYEKQLVRTSPFVVVVIRDSQWQWDSEWSGLADVGRLWTMHAPKQKADESCQRRCEESCCLPGCHLCIEDSRNRFGLHEELRTQPDAQGIARQKQSAGILAAFCVIRTGADVAFNVCSFTKAVRPTDKNTHVGRQ